MKLNNKGMTLIELLVSIVLISIVLVFLFQLMLDLKNEAGNNSYAYNNQINRTEAIYTIENDLEKNTLVGIEDVSASGSVAINFYYRKNGGTTTAKLWLEKIEADDEIKYYLKYIDFNNDRYSWEMKGVTEINPCGSFTYYFNNTSSNYYFKLHFDVYTENEGNSRTKNNVVDDIEIVYSGDKRNLNLTKSNYLINNANNHITKNVGTCTY